MKAKRILIVEDDKAFAKAVASRCQSLGLVSRISSEGLHGLMTALQAPPDIVLLDVSLPGADGLRVLQALRNDNRLASIPVVVVTGRSDEETVHRCRALNARYVWKGLNTWGELEPILRELSEAV